MVVYTNFKIKKKRVKYIRSILIHKVLLKFRVSSILFYLEDKSQKSKKNNGNLMTIISLDFQSWNISCLIPPHSVAALVCAQTHLAEGQEFKLPGFHTAQFISDLKCSVVVVVPALASLQVYVTCCRLYDGSRYMMSPCDLHHILQAKGASQTIYVTGSRR